MVLQSTSDIVAPVSQQSLAIIRATAPVVKDNAEAITSVFYPKMLGRHPELYKYFNETNQRKVEPGASSQQSKTLADAIVSCKCTGAWYLCGFSERVG